VCVVWSKLGRKQICLTYPVGRVDEGMLVFGQVRHGTTRRAVSLALETPVWVKQSIKSWMF